MKAALKSSIFLFFLEQLCYFNLSPQGDETIFQMCLLQSFIIFQLIPARGRKRASITTIRILNQISTYPRKGTETVYHEEWKQRYYYFNLSPQGDGNVNTLMSVLLFGISTYPRKGTETQSHLLHYRSQEYFNLSPQTLSGAARQLSRRESFSSCRYPVLSSPFRGSWHGVSRD